MQVRLVVQDRRRQHVFRLGGETAVIGRARGSAVRIPSPDVSRRHCRLRLHDDYVTAEDLASVNGTFLNGEPIDTEVVVRPGDRLEVGPVTFVVEYDLTPDALHRMVKDDFEVVAEEGGAMEVTADDVVGGEDEDVVDAVLDEEEDDAVDAVLADDDDAPTAAGGRGEGDEYFLDEEGTWRAPEGGDLRDLLAGLEEGEEVSPGESRHAPRPKGNADGGKRPKRPPPDEDE
jgi:hypothetical protein